LQAEAEVTGRVTRRLAPYYVQSPSDSKLRVVA
jgi:hypothetical protein